MARQTSETNELTLNPSGYDSSTLTFTSSYYKNINNGCNGISNTSYARFTMRNTSYHIYYTFDSPSIPTDATINSVSCIVKGYVSNSSYYPSLQLYTSTIAKGSSSTITSTSSSNTLSLTCGTWTASELNSSIQLYITASKTSTKSSYYFYFYGADLVINYTYQETIYEVTISNNNDTITTDPTDGTYDLTLSSNVISFYDYSDDVMITDNNEDISSSLVEVTGSSESYYTYTISDLTQDHTILIESGDSYYIRISGEYVRINKYYKNINGVWTLLSKTELFDYLNTSIFVYGGTLGTFGLGWMTIVTGETIQMRGLFNNELITNGVTWSIISGNDYASIDSSGLVTINSNADNSNVTVQGIYNNLTATKLLNVTYGEGTTVITTVTETITNEDGSITEKETTTEESEDGTVSTTENSTTENQDGTSSSTTTTTIENSNGTSTSSSITINYDENGDTIGSSNTTTNTASDGSSTSTTTNYDENGDAITGSTTIIDTSGNLSTQSIEYDENGNTTVTSYSIDTSNNEDGGKSISNAEDTGYIAFASETGFVIDLNAYFNLSEQTDSSGYYTLLNLMYETQPWPGICIRYEKGKSNLFIITAGTNLSNYISLTIPDDSIYSLRITYDKTADTVTYYNKLTETSIRTVSINGVWDDIDFNNLTAMIGASYNPSTGQPYRYGKCEIYEFNIQNL